MTIEIGQPVKGERILYRHGRADLPFGTPAVVPGVVYDQALVADGLDYESDAVVVVLAHDGLGCPILVRGRVGEPAHRLPRAAYCPGAELPGTWCYAFEPQGRRAV